MTRPAVAPVATRSLGLVSFIVASLVMAGCASRPSTPDPRDPFERFNRASYKFNDTLDRAILKPTAKGYKAVAPQFVEAGVSNFFDNLGQPTVIVNDLLQAKFKPALTDTGRFLVNTTLGVGGLFDPASSFGLDGGDEDFGQTLGKWGVSSGPYLMIPIFGPSTVRDGFGSIADAFTDPTNYVERDVIRYSVNALGLINTRASLLEAEKAMQDSYDKYAFLRNAFLQRREYQVLDGNVSPANFDEEELEEARREADEEAAK
jgi:phospholipid-binding lipoprotein MlaA